MLNITKISLIICLLALNTYPVLTTQANSSQDHSKPAQITTHQTGGTPDKASNSTSDPEDQITHDEPRELSMFFKIGIGLNIIMLIVYVTWAVRQWRQSDRQK